jgi:putative pyrroloquinoline-quinone binding quinoprotein
MKTLLLLTLTFPIFSQIVEANYDRNRTNATTSETQLTLTNVKTTTFGLRCTASVDDRVFAQPLFVPAITISGAQHDIFIVATMGDSLYAFDARTCAQLWVNLRFDTPYAGYPVFEGGLYGALGCLSTPVVDVGNSKVYAVCDSATGPTWIARAFSLTTGAILYSSALSGQVVGTGDTGVTGGTSAPGPPDTTSGANLLFYPRYSFQRAALVLSADTGTLYVGFGGLDDNRPYHGWLMARNTSDLSAKAIVCFSPNSWGAAVWMSGGAPAVDGSGNLYFGTGNGYKAADPTANDNAAVKMLPDLSSLSSYTPVDEPTDDTGDLDVASDRFLLIPGTDFGVIASKDFNVYLIRLSTMTLAQAAFLTCGGCSTSFSSGSYGMAFFNNTLFVPITAGTIYAYTWNPGSSTFTTTPVWTQSNSYGVPGAAQIAGSCNGTSNCILWVVTANASSHTAAQPGTLRAINAATGAEIWNSGSTLGNMMKFAAPLVANGRVFVSTPDAKVQVFGLQFSSQMRGATTMRGSAVIR